MATENMGYPETGRASLNTGGIGSARPHINALNSSRRSDGAPSERARSGQGWTSTISPWTARHRDQQIRSL